jgi:hypothetical protein
MGSEGAHAGKIRERLHINSKFFLCLKRGPLNTQVFASQCIQVLPLFIKYAALLFYIRLQIFQLLLKGFKFILFFIHPGTRRVIVSGITTNPDSAWMKQQARNVTGDIRDLGFPTPEVLVIDYDYKYPREFDAIFESEGTKIRKSRKYASFAVKRTHRSPAMPVRINVWVFR